MVKKRGKSDREGVSEREKDRERELERERDRERERERERQEMQFMRIDKIAAECIDFIFMYHYLRCPKINKNIFLSHKITRINYL